MRDVQVFRQLTCHPSLPLRLLRGHVPYPSATWFFLAPLGRWMGKHAMQADAPPSTKQSRAEMRGNVVPAFPQLLPAQDQDVVLTEVLGPLAHPDPWVRVRLPVVS